jgi:hypothetical protein
VLAPVMQHMTALVAVVQFAAAIVGVCVSLKVVTSQAVIAVTVYAMTIAQLLPIGFFLIPWLWRSGRAFHDVLKHASADDLLARLQNMQVHSRHQVRERLAKAAARAKAKVAKADPPPLPPSPLLNPTLRGGREDAATVRHKSFAFDRALSAPPTPTQEPLIDELETPLLRRGDLGEESGTPQKDADGGDPVPSAPVGQPSSATYAPATVANVWAATGGDLVDGSSHGWSTTGASHPGARLFDGLTATATAGRAHVSSTSWENAHGPSGSGGESDLHKAFAAAARARMSSRNPLARSAGGNLVGDVVLPPAADGANLTFHPHAAFSPPIALAVETPLPDTGSMEAALVLLLVGFGAETSPSHGLRREDN